jgi:peptide chain release factor 1
LTDHRINLTLYKLDRVMMGELDEVVSALIADHQSRLLAEIGTDA